MAATWPAKTDYTTGSVLTAAQMNAIGEELNDVHASSAATSLGFTAGKNCIINGDFKVNQRNFTSTTTAFAYGFDRWNLQTDASSVTYSAQTFTAGAAPVAGYEGTNYARLLTTSQSGAGNYAMLQQKVEDVRTYANQTATISFWARAASGTPKIGVAIDQNFGSGGSAAVTTASATVSTISTSWTRYSFPITIPSISGKTIGSSSYLGLNIVCSMTASYTPPYPAVGLQNNTFDIWGVQMEIGSTATSFQTATGTIQGELAACQRYYFRTNWQGTSAYACFGFGFSTSTTAALISIPFPVNMRTKPSSIDYGGSMRVTDSQNNYTPSSFTLDSNISMPQSTGIVANTGGILTLYRPYYLGSIGDASAYVGFNAEL